MHSKSQREQSSSIPTTATKRRLSWEAIAAVAGVLLALAGAGVTEIRSSADRDNSIKSLQGQTNDQKQTATDAAKSIDKNRDDIAGLKSDVREIKTDVSWIRQFLDHHKQDSARADDDDSNGG